MSDANGDNRNTCNAIGSTEPTVEDKAHYTPEMQALADRDGQKVFVCGKHHTAKCGVDRLPITQGGPTWALMGCGYIGHLQKRG